MSKIAHVQGSAKNEKGVGYIECEAEPGMFNDELLVFITGVDPQNPDQAVHAQVLVDSDLVKGLKNKPERGKPVKGELRVGIVRISKGIAVVVLPQTGIPVGESMAVREAILAKG